MPVCLSARISHPNSQNFVYVLTVAVTQSLCEESPVHYVLPVVLMTSCMTNQADVMPTECILKVIRQRAAVGAKSDVYDCLALHWMNWSVASWALVDQFDATGYVDLSYKL